MQRPGDGGWRRRSCCGRRRLVSEEAGLVGGELVGGRASSDEERDGPRVSGWCDDVSDGAKMADETLLEDAAGLPAGHEVGQMPRNEHAVVMQYMMMRNGDDDDDDFLLELLLNDRGSDDGLRCPGPGLQVVAVEQGESNARRRRWREDDEGDQKAGAWPRVR